MEKKLKFKKIEILSYLILIINIPPAFFTRISSIDRLYSIFQFLYFIILALIFLANIKKNGFSKIIFFITMFWFVYILSTLYNQGNIATAIRPFFSTFSLCFFYEIYIKSKYKYDVIRVAKNYFSILIYINLLTIFLFPNGLYDANNENAHYFLGHKNNSIEYIIPSICFSLLSDELRNKGISINSKILMICSIITVIITWSANAIVAVAFLLITLFLPIRYLFDNIINCFNAVLAYIFAFFLIVIYRMQYLFAWFIQNILHKSLDFTYRTYIWDKSLVWIRESLLLGYGYENPSIKVLKIGHPNSSHNYILDFLYMGGMVELVIFAIIIILVMNKLKKIKSRFGRILTCSVCIYFVIGFATPVHKETLCLMFLIFLLSYFVPYFNGDGGEANK